jgi:glycosyltransferase involved in cell wall biosynthesis
VDDGLDDGEEGGGDMSEIRDEEGSDGTRAEAHGAGDHTPKLSVFLITRNESAHLDLVLERVRGADEIVVVDSGSDDDTVEIARRHGARVIERAWPGYVRQKAFALERCTHDWVLNLDGDEVLPPDGLERIRRHISRTRANGLYIGHDDIFMGQTLRGHRHHRYCRVYRKSRASWDLGLKVHEHIDVEGPTEHIPVTLTHLGYDSAHGYMEKLNAYSELKARQRTERGRGFSNARLFLVFPVMFIKFFVFRRMFLSGRRGFIKAWIDATQYFLTEAKLYEGLYREKSARTAASRDAGARDGGARDEAGVDPSDMQRG